MKARETNCTRPGVRGFTLEPAGGLQPNCTRSILRPGGAIAASWAWICDSSAPTSTDSDRASLGLSTDDEVAAKHDAAINAIVIMMRATLINCLLALDESIGSTLHIVWDLHGLGAGLICALGGNEAHQFLHGAFVRHFDESLGDRTEAILSTDSGLRCA